MKTHSEPRCLPRVAAQLIALGILTLAGAQSFAQTTGKTFAAAAVKAQPGLQCTLHPAGSAATDGITLFTNADGYARFHAVKASANEPGAMQTLDCKDKAGKTSSYKVDLAAPETFAAHPFDVAKEPGVDRPALTADLANESTQTLIDKGYGVRPDKATQPEAYARWLAAASRPARLVAADKPLLRPNTVTSSTAAPWAGSVMTGSPKYSITQATFNVPTVVPSGDGTSATHMALWNGIGGFRTGGGLIQGGIQIDSTATTAGYLSFREYCCGDTNEHDGSSFTPNPKDQIFSQQWYCNADGGVDINGGFGCSLVHDLTTGQALSCTSSTGSPCASVKANVLCSVQNVTNCFTLGLAAEFIAENQSGGATPEWTDFTPAVTMTGSATSLATNKSETISTDPTVTVLLDWTKTATHLVVALASTDETVFSIEPAQPSFEFYCQGPLQTSTGGTPLTPFVWAAKPAGEAAPGPGQCAWADRLPRGTEIKTGNRNTLSGYLNQYANLTAEKFAHLAVYRDPAAGNDMVITQVLAAVSPPFSSNPFLP